MCNNEKLRPLYFVQGQWPSGNKNRREPKVNVKIKTKFIEIQFRYIQFERYHRFIIDLTIQFIQRIKNKAKQINESLHAFLQDKRYWKYLTLTLTLQAFFHLQNRKQMLHFRNIFIQSEMTIIVWFENNWTNIISCKSIKTHIITDFNPLYLGFTYLFAKVNGSSYMNISVFYPLYTITDIQWNVINGKKRRTSEKETKLSLVILKCEIFSQCITIWIVKPIHIHDRNIKEHIHKGYKDNWIIYILKFIRIYNSIQMK